MTSQRRISRRRAMHAAAVTAGGAAVTASFGSTSAVRSSPVSNVPDLQKTPWIDAHSHIWTTDLKSYPLRDNQPVEVLAPRSFTDEELMAIAEPEGVGRVVLIQHHPYHGFDNTYLIDTWKKHPGRFRIVGQIDDRRDGVGLMMKEMLKTGVTGFRIGPRGDQPDWIGGDGMKTMWKTAAETRQSMCCLINPDNIAQLPAMCREFPETPVVIDHFARIGGDGQIRDNEVDALCRLSGFPTVRIKISAYYAFGEKKPPHYELVPMIRKLYEAYGADRLMWASDCPYQLTSPNTYRDSIALIRDHIDFVTPAERKMLLAGTAESTFFYT